MKARCDQNKLIGRLKRRPDFLAVQAAGRKWIAPTLIVQMKETTEPPRFGLTVTKKTLPRAVDRNRVRRRLRAIVLEVLADFPSFAADFVVIARSESLTALPEKLQADLRWCLKKLQQNLSAKPS